MIEEHPDPNKRWRNRRRMAWLCMWGSVLFPAVFILTDSPNLAEIAWPFYTFNATVVLVYIAGVVAERWGPK